MFRAASWPRRGACATPSSALQAHVTMRTYNPHVCRYEGANDYLVAFSGNNSGCSVQDRVVVAHTPHSHKPITFYHPAVQCACMFLGEFLCIIPYLYQQWKQWSQKPSRQPPPGRSAMSFIRGSSVSEPLLSTQHAPSPLDQPRAPHSTARAHGNNGFPVERTAGDVSQSVFVLAVPTLCDATSSLLMSVGLFYTSASIFQMLRGLVVFFAGALPATRHLREYRHGAKCASLWQAHVPLIPRISSYACMCTNATDELRDDRVLTF
jgi:hypothetical protein